jgi:hypothetical protein
MTHGVAFDVTLTITAKEVSMIKRLLIKEEWLLEKLRRNEYQAELTALRHKIHNQI